MPMIIRNNIRYATGGSNQIVKLTQAEYDALPNDKLSNNTIYLITDSGELTAENLFYDDTETGLGVNNVQDAIVEQNKKSIQIKYQKNTYSTVVVIDEKIASVNGAFDFPSDGKLGFVGTFPKPMNGMFPILVRDNTDGTFKHLYLDNSGILQSYNGGCVAGHNYSLAFTYNIVF